MKILLLVIMMFFTVMPCQATTIYSVQFADNNGVYTGGTDYAVCVLNLTYKNELTSVVLVDINNGMCKIIEVNGKTLTDKKEKWEPMNANIIQDITEYVRLNYDSIVQASRNNPQSAYQVN